MNRQQEMKKVGGTPPFCIDVRKSKKADGPKMMVTWADVFDANLGIF